MSLTKNDVLELINPIKVSQIQTLKKNENADRLWVVQVNDGESVKQIVTGASNMKEGDFVAFLGVGSVVPGFLFRNGETIVLEKRPLRGYDSEGMLLAEDEIGISEDHEGLLILNTTPEYLGKSILEVLSEAQVEKILETAGIVEVSSEVIEKYNVLTRDLAEVIGEKEVLKTLSQRNLKIYWGTAPTGKPSIGYFVPMIKIGDFLKVDSEVTILLANMHAYLDNMKSTWELLEYRNEVYKLITTEILKSFNIPVEKLKFVKGTDYQLTQDYTLDMYKIAVQTTVQSVKGAGAEVVKQVENPVLGGMLYPILQALDEQYLGVDVQLGGVDQRKIFMFAREYLPRVGYQKRSHFMNPLIPGLGKSGKMSSSEPGSKIDFDDSDEVIKSKIDKAFSVDGEVEGNGLLALLKYIIFRKLEIEGRAFVVERDEKWGGTIEYKTYAELEQDFIEKKLSSVDLKPAIARETIHLVEPIRNALSANSELLEKAYPTK